MSAAAKKRDPQIVNKIFALVESGSLPNEIIEKLTADKIASTETFDDETFPDKIMIISQALAFRTPTIHDIAEIFTVLSSAYKGEIVGSESFRKGTVFTRSDVSDLFEDSTYDWLLVEAPSGRGIINDGSIIACCCYSKDGVSKRNGVVEGNLGTFRFFGILPQFHGVFLGSRLLRKVEQLMFTAGCCRSMVCIPSPRESIQRWIERNGYIKVGEQAYPSKALKHDLLNEETNLILFVKKLISEDGTSLEADSKGKTSLSLTKSNPMPESTSSKSAMMAMSPIWRQQDFISNNKSSISDDIEGDRGYLSDVD